MEYNIIRGFAIMFIDLPFPTLLNVYLPSSPHVSLREKVDMSRLLGPWPPCSFPGC